MATPALTSNSVANRAIQLIGDNQPAVTGEAPTFDNSVAGKALAVLYAGAVQTVGRQWGFDFSRAVATLALSGNPAPFPWALEYVYPSMGVQVRQLLPPALADPNDPLPINWSVGNTLVAGVNTKVIWTNEADASAYYSNQPGEATWDPLFTEDVVRLLASELAMAIAAKPDTARDAFEQGAGFEQISQARDS